MTRKLTVAHLASGRLEPGVYRIVDPELSPSTRAEMVRRKVNLHRLAVTAATDREELFESLRTALGLPDWFGKNLDALADSLSEFDGDHCVEVIGSAALPRSLRPTLHAIVEVFNDHAEFGGSIVTVVCGDDDIPKSRRLI
jgi:RNAse (barnase) inhibitor barstar